MPLCSNSFLHVYTFPPTSLSGLVRNQMAIIDVSPLHQLVPNYFAVHSFEELDLLPDETLCCYCIKQTVCPLAIPQLPTHVQEAILQNLKPIFGVLVVELLEVRDSTHRVEDSVVLNGR